MTDSLYIVQYTEQYLERVYSVTRYRQINKNTEIQYSRRGRGEEVGGGGEDRNYSLIAGAASISR